MSRYRQARGVHPLGNWATSSPKGYPRFYSGEFRNRYVHRVVWEQLAGRPVPSGWQIHHQDFDKLNFAGWNLIACPPEFNPANQLRCPYTGQFLSIGAYERRFGTSA